MDKEKENVKQDDKKKTLQRIVMLLTIFLNIVYLTWRLLRTIPIEYGGVSAVLGIALYVVEFLGFFELLVHYGNMLTYQKLDVPDVPMDRMPDVDIFIATYNEPVELLYKTVNGCKHMDYPDKSKVHIYVCDDGHRKEMREMCERMGVNYITRSDNAHAKAGNLNHALSVTNSPYIATFDADMIPRHEFLLRTIPFFVKQEMDNEGLPEKKQTHIGFVQTPQAFYNPDLYQYNLYSEDRIPNEQDYFYRDIQVARNRSNSVIYGGSNTVLSRRALNAIGGFFDKSITEDYGTGISMQKAGFRCIATSEVLASGLSATDLQSLINQRVRWGRGVINTNRIQHILLSPKLSIAQKANYWASEFYWYSPFKRLIFYISPLVYAVFGYVVVKCNFLEVLLFWLPMNIFSGLSMRMMSQNIRSVKWTSIYETVLFPFMMIPILMEACFISMKKFKVTQKGNVDDANGTNWIYMTPFLVLIVLSVISICRCIITMMQSNRTDPIVVLCWTIYNLYVLVMACFFTMNRKYGKECERVAVSLGISITTKGLAYKVRTYDLSEEDLTVSSRKPMFLIPEEEVTLEIKTDRYHATMTGVLDSVTTLKNRWKYTIKITDYRDCFDDYLQIMYDRLPATTQDLQNGASVFDDLSVNIDRRKEFSYDEKTTEPEILVSQIVKDTEGHEYRMVDYNYQECTLELGETAPESLTVCLNDTKLDLERMYCLEGKTTYKIKNYVSLYKNAKSNKKVEFWVLEHLQKQVVSDKGTM